MEFYMIMDGLEVHFRIIISEDNEFYKKNYL